ncbi:hypothetical protein DSO57_1018218 [Entomophthora muscae]|uniref:Uncharacterized protein n=1 Tax=Entomophthora muscae TaxID=34485 RepID=A0ACC2RVK7_9FUNG|nr:hypothetical protein DSO57_1018218 [Entomophthora muscae]
MVVVHPIQKSDGSFISEQSDIFSRTSTHLITANQAIARDLAGIGNPRRSQLELAGVKLDKDSHDHAPGMYAKLALTIN